MSWPNLNCPTYNFSTRNTILRIYELFTLELSYRQHIEPALFVSCVMPALESEADPRNLLLSFDLKAFILANYCNTQSIDNEMLEQFFDTIFDNLNVYFPINFEPPKDDKNKITPEDL